VTEAFPAAASSRRLRYCPLSSGISYRLSAQTAQEVCPFNRKFADEADEPGYAARGPGELPSGVEALPGERTVEAGGNVSAETHPETSAPSLIELMRMTRAEWDAFSRGSAIRRAGYEGFKRNVAVAMGNWPTGLEGQPPEEAVAVLSLILVVTFAAERRWSGPAAPVPAMEERFDLVAHRRPRR